MTGDYSSDVRPTKRSLSSLELPVPDLGTRLGALDHPVIRKAQMVPQEQLAGRIELIRSLSDRRWLKAKTGEWRAADADLARELPAHVLEISASQASRVSLGCRRHAL